MKKTLLIMIMASLLSLSSPVKTNAQYVDIAQNLKEFALDGVAYQVSAIALKRLTATTVNWINSGFKGNPLYVQNPRQFFLDIGDETASAFLSQAGVNQLCAPFNAQVRLALVKNYINPDTTNYTCTLDILRNNYEAFTRDFSQGGWQGWFELTQNSQNNPYGAYLEAQNTLSMRISAAQATRQRELDLSGGFLNVKRCPRGAEVIDPISQQTICTQEEITTTPGVLINDQLSRSLGSSWERLNAADEFNEIVTALLTQLVEKIVGGAGSLFTSSERDASGRVFTNSLRDEQQPITNYRITATAPSINCTATGGSGGDGGDPDGGGGGGDGGQANCRSTPGTVGGLPPWPLGAGGGSGGHCPAYTPDPNVDCTTVSSSAVLSVLNGYPASNYGMRQAAPIISSRFGGELMEHPIRLDKFNFGNGMIVDVMIGAVGNEGPDGEYSIAEGGWGWLVECACNRNPAGHENPAPPTPLPGVGTYTVTFTVSGVGSLSDGVDELNSVTMASTTISKVYPRGSHQSISATPGIGHTFVGWGGACAVFGTQPTCSGIVSADGSVWAIFRPI